MSDSSECSMTLAESELKQSQSHRPNSIFGRIYSLFRNGFLNALDDEGKRTETKNNDSSKKKLKNSNGISTGKVTKPSKLKKTKIKTQRLNNEQCMDVNVNQEQLNAPIKRPILDSLKLGNIDTLDSSHKTASHKVTYEGRRDIRPEVIQLGPRKAIRINPNSSTSTMSLSPPPAAQVSPPPLEIPVSPPPAEPVSPPSAALVSPPTVSLWPPAVSVSSPGITFSPPTVPVSPPVMESRLLFYGTNDQISPSQHISTPNTSTPFRSRSRMIRVNTIEDLDEQQERKGAIQHNDRRSFTQENFNEVCGVASTKENRKKTKKSKDGQKRKRKREILRDEDNKILRLAESNGKIILTEAEDNDLNFPLEAIRPSNINNIHNPFHISTESGENTAPNRIDSQGYIANISGYLPKDNNNPYNVSSNSRNGFVTKDKTFNNRNIADNEFRKSQFGTLDTNLESPNAVQKEVGDISKLFMSSEIDSEEDRVILEYRSKSRQCSELKWPGHDSIGDIILPSEPKTPAKGQVQSTGKNDSKDANSSNKPRLLSDIMAERYKMDGISFLGTFKTPHIPFNADNKSNDDLDSITEDKRESPVYRKFGIDVRKERFREEDRLDKNNSVN